MAGQNCARKRNNKTEKTCRTTHAQCDCPMTLIKQFWGEFPCFGSYLSPGTANIHLSTYWRAEGIHKQWSPGPRWSSSSSDGTDGLVPQNKGGCTQVCRTVRWLKTKFTFSPFNSYTCIKWFPFLTHEWTHATNLMNILYMCISGFNHMRLHETTHISISYVSCA